MHSSSPVYRVAPKSGFSLGACPGFPWVRADEGAGIPHREPRLLKAGGGARPPGALASPRAQRDGARVHSAPGTTSARDPTLSARPELTVPRVRVYTADAAVGQHLQVESDAHVAVESPQPFETQQVVPCAAADRRLPGLRGHRQACQRAGHQAVPAAPQFGVPRAVGCGSPSVRQGHHQGQQDPGQQRRPCGRPALRHSGPRAVRELERRAVSSVSAARRTKPRE